MRLSSAGEPGCPRGAVGAGHGWLALCLSGQWHGVVCAGPCTRLPHRRCRCSTASGTRAPLHALHPPPKILKPSRQPSSLGAKRAAARPPPPPSRPAPALPTTSPAPPRPRVHALLPRVHHCAVTAAAPRSGPAKTACRRRNPCRRRRRLPPRCSPCLPRPPPVPASCCAARTGAQAARAARSARVAAARGDGAAGPGARPGGRGVARGGEGGGVEGPEDIPEAGGGAEGERLLSCVCRCGSRAARRGLDFDGRTKTSSWQSGLRGRQPIVFARVNSAKGSPAPPWGLQACRSMSCGALAATRRPCLHVYRTQMLATHGPPPCSFFTHMLLPVRVVEIQPSHHSCMRSWRKMAHSHGTSLAAALQAPPPQSRTFTMWIAHTLLEGGG